METPVVILIAASVLLLAAVVVIIVFASRIGRLKGEKVALEGQLKAQDDTYRALDAQRAEQQRQLDAERAEQQRRLAEERDKAFESQRKQMEESFRTLSEQNSAGLRRQNAESLGELLKPIQEKFSGFEKTVQDSQKLSVAQDAAMRELLKTVMEQSRTVGEEAKNLANALTGQAKIQGDFGEMLLVDILKNSGLEEGVHFKTQGVILDERGHEVKSETGRTLIPDVIVYYPDDTEVIIDSKVSLTAYVNYSNATSLEDRQRFAKEHINSVSSHIDELKRHDYASYIEPNRKKVDYNIMFIPMEGAFRLMLEEAPTLWQRAKDAKVLIVSQMNLMIVLNMILMNWRQHDQEKNIREVYDTASALMSQLKTWMDSFVKVGDSLEGALSAYNDSKKKLTESNQSVVRKIDKLERLKLAPKRSNARIKAGARMVGGQESIIPVKLADGLDKDEAVEATDNEQ